MDGGALAVPVGLDATNDALADEKDKPDSFGDADADRGRTSMLAAQTVGTRRRLTFGSGRPPEGCPRRNELLDGPDSGLVLSQVTSSSSPNADSKSLSNAPPAADGLR